MRRCAMRALYGRRAWFWPPTPSRVRWRHTVQDRPACEKTPHCVWCESVAVPSFCALDSEAKR